MRRFDRASVLAQAAVIIDDLASRARGQRRKLTAPSLAAPTDGATRRASLGSCP